MFGSQIISLLAEIYQWTSNSLDVNDLDEPKYTLSKKLSEVSLSPIPAQHVTDDRVVALKSRQLCRGQAISYP